MQTLACQPWGGAAHYRAVLTPGTRAVSTATVTLPGLGSALSAVGRPNSEDNCPWQGTTAHHVEPQRMAVRQHDPIPRAITFCHSATLRPCGDPEASVVSSQQR